jgi:hypothetical protein
MAVIEGTLQGCTLVSGNPNGVGGYKVYLCTYSFPVYDSSADTGTVLLVAAGINAKLRDGKTRAMVAGVLPVRAHAGQDTNGVPVYFGTTTISTTSLTFSLTDEAQTEAVGDYTASSGIGLLVPILES